MDLTSDEYRASQAKQFGNLHERMKFAMERLQELYGCGVDINDLWQAMFDLQLEVSFHTPAEPPYGRRMMKDLPFWGGAGEQR